MVSAVETIPAVVSLCLSATATIFLTVSARSWGVPAAVSVKYRLGEGSQAEAIYFPTVVGGVVPIYNLSDVGHTLNVTPQLLADIYAGAIRKWNDPRIRQINGGAHFPDGDIAVVHRSDGSGTTYAWTSYLSLASPAWKSKLGEGARVEWPVGVGADGNEGVAQTVAKTPNSIG